MIYLRSKNDTRGDVLDYLWYCSQGCYAVSFNVHPASVAESIGIEKGGAYPCGAEHDLPDFCATCGEPVGNPLTDDGIEYVQEWVADLPFRLDPTGTLDKRAESLRRVYPHLFNSGE